MWNIFHTNKKYVDKFPHITAMTIDRITEIIGNEALSVRSFEKKIDVKQGSINKAIRNQGNVYSIVLEKILENFPQYNAEWLITGKGGMMKSMSGEFLKDSGKVELLKEQLSEKDFRIIELEKELEIMKRKKASYQIAAEE